MLQDIRYCDYYRHSQLCVAAVRLGWLLVVVVVGISCNFTVSYQIWCQVHNCL